MTNDSFVTVRGHSSTPLTRRGSPGAAMAMSGVATSMMHARTNRALFMVAPPGGAPPASGMPRLDLVGEIFPYTGLRGFDDGVASALSHEQEVLYINPTAPSAPCHPGDIHDRAHGSHHPRRRGRRGHARSVEDDAGDVRSARALRRIRTRRPAGLHARAPAGHRERYRDAGRGRLLAHR